MWRFLLVRHARPEVVAGGTQAADSGLTEEGRGQAELLAKAVASGVSAYLAHVVGLAEPFF